MVKILGIIGVAAGMGHMFWNGPSLAGIGVLCFANSIMLLSLIFKSDNKEEKENNSKTP